MATGRAEHEQDDGPRVRVGGVGRTGNEPVPAGRPRWIEAVELVSIVAFAGAWGAVLARLAVATPLPRWSWLLPTALLAGLVAADLASGLVHWFADRYFDPATPVVGPLLIEPFREHHRHPEAMARHGFLELSGNNALATLPLAGLVLYAGPPGTGVALQALHAFVAILALALFATNLFHAWAHHPQPPRLAVRLQRARLVLTPATHARHHRGGHDQSYCVTGGWLNPMLDRLQVFARLERGLARIGVGRPRDGGGVRSRARAGSP